MEKYKHPKIGFIWYSVMVITIINSAKYPTMCSVCFIALCIRYIFYYLSKKRAQHCIEKIKSQLANIKDVKELEGIVRAAMKKKQKLRKYLLQMVADKMRRSIFVSYRIGEIIANGRPCYHICSITIVKKKKENDSYYYDISKGNTGRLYIFNNNVEWFEGVSHRALPIKNILQMSLDSDGEILVLVRRGEGSPIYFYTPYAVIIMCIIEQIQKGK